jgi:deoxyribodipyrimidine photolyase-related protein
MKSISLIFPNQLFKEIPFRGTNSRVYLIEENLFFNQYKFHKQKITFHRASMKYYESYLISNGIDVVYINAQDKLSDIRFLIEYLGNQNFKEINLIDPVDNWLNKRIEKAASKYKTVINSIENPSFLNTQSDLDTFFNKNNKKYFQTKFYIEQRKKRNILVDENLNPSGEKWSFDVENRKKYPKNLTPPEIEFPAYDRFYQEAVEYVENNFRNYGFRIFYFQDLKILVLMKML